MPDYAITAAAPGDAPACAAIGARLAAEGMEPDVFRAAQMPDPQAFMRHFLAQGYVITGSALPGEWGGL